jgi:hypothetical protein
MAALLRWLGITIDPVMDFGEELAFRDFQWVLRRSSSRQPASKETMEIHHIFISLSQEPRNPEVYSKYSRSTTRQMD